MKIQALLFVCFLALSTVAAGQKRTAIDWINAPVNPIPPAVEQHLLSNGPIQGDVVALGDNWYGLDKKKLITRYMTDKDRAKEFRGICVVFDAAGNATEEYSYTAGQEFLTTHTYNLRGFYTSKTNVADGRKNTFEYDAKGRIVKDILVGKDFMYTTQYTYKTNGKTLEVDEKQYNATNVLVNHFIRTYENGLLRALEEVGQEKFTYTYEYDTYKNWIKRTRLNGNDATTDTRTIIYRNQIKDPSAVKLIVENGAYRPIAKVYISDIPTTLPTFLNGDDVYFFNPLELRYFKATGAKTQLIPANMGKELPLTGFGKNTGLLKVDRLMLVNGNKTSV